MAALIICSILLTLGFGELYARWQALLGANGWLPILCLHAIMTLGLLTLFSGMRKQLKIDLLGLWGFLPACLVLLGTLILTFAFPKFGPSRDVSLSYFLASCTLIPFVEEVVFRGGVSATLDRVWSSGWSGYFSALVFSLAHTIPSWDRVMALKIGLPLGPFLLGLICEYLTRRTRSFLPAIAFHCACNSTVLIFNTWSPGWFDTFAAFYLN